MRRYPSWTLVTACFSHRDWAHILFNGFTFFFMAQPVLKMLGSRQFIFLYLGGLELFLPFALSLKSLPL
jgi:membrane associated rhomboid family serine protease